MDEKELAMEVKWGGKYQMCYCNTLISMFVITATFLGSFQLIIVVENNVSNQNMEQHFKALFLVMGRIACQEKKFIYIFLRRMMC